MYISRDIQHAAKVAFDAVHIILCLIAAGSVQGVDAIITPALKAVMSKQVPPQEQGLW